MGTAIHNYILDHDNRWSFIIAYITLAVVLAIVLNLFWLAAVVAVHGVFEWVVHSHELDDKIAVASRVAWELKLDVGLILFGLALEVYIEVVFGVVGLGAATRAAAVGGRFAILQNVLRGTLLSLDDLAQVIRMVGAKKATEGTDGDLDFLDGPEVEEAVVIEEDDEEYDEEDQDDDEEEEDRLGPWRGPYTRGAILSIAFGFVWLFLIIAAPFWIESHTFGTVWEAIVEEMHPLAWRD